MKTLGITQDVDCQSHHGSGTEILKNIGSFKPVSEAIEPSLPDLFSSFISNDFPSLFHDHKFRNGCNVISLLQLTVKIKDGRSWRQMYKQTENIRTT